MPKNTIVRMPHQKKMMEVVIQKMIFVFFMMFKILAVA